MGEGKSLWKIDRGREGRREEEEKRDGGRVRKKSGKKGELMELPKTVLFSDFCYYAFL